MQTQTAPKKTTNLLARGLENRIKRMSKDGVSDPMVEEIVERRDRLKHKITKNRRRNKLARISRRKNR